MNNQVLSPKRPIALVILDGWGYAPRTEGNAIATANTPFYDEICRRYPMTTLAASGEAIGQVEGQPGNAELGHLILGTGRAAQTEVDRIKSSIASGGFMDNPVLNRAFTKAQETDCAVHLIGLLSEGGIHSSVENLFATIRLAKRFGLKKVFIHCILDGLDVAPRTADVYVEALEIKLADIGLGQIATLCGRFFAMNTTQNWDRTARAFTMLVHAEGERTRDAVTAIRSSFLRGISDEFIAPIVVERAMDFPVAIIKNGDLVVFFNHRADGMKQLVRSLCIPDGTGGTKPVIDTVCLTEYDRGFNLPSAFRPEPEKNSLTEVLEKAQVPLIRITENARSAHLTRLFDGGEEREKEPNEVIVLNSAPDSDRDSGPESQSFKIADSLIRSLEAAPGGVFVVNMPAADLMGETGDLERTVAAMGYLDTCLAGICEKVKAYGGVAMITSSHGRCEAMLDPNSGEKDPSPTANRVPFHLVDHPANLQPLNDHGSLSDVAPTVLAMLGLDRPAEMTGSDLRTSLA